MDEPSILKEPGFENFGPCFDHVYEQIRLAKQNIGAGHKQIELVVVDACVPKSFQNGQRVLVTNNWLVADQLDPELYEQFPKTWYGIYAGHVPIEPSACVRKFNCFMNRMDVLRQSWLYQLIRRSVFDQGLISFNMDISRHIMHGKCQPNDSPSMIFESQFQQHLQIFGPEHEFIRSRVPYRNFESGLNQAIMQTEFSVVLETYFERNEVITLSEKIFRAMKLPRPWVLFSMQNAVKYLRDLGFDVLDDLVDHSYDEIDFVIDRQIAILDQIEILCGRTLTESQKLRCQQAAQHNQRLLFTMLARFHDDVAKTCQNATLKCLK